MMNSRRSSNERLKKFFMSRVRSLIIRTEIDEALKAHNCQRSSQHRIEKGHRRLKVRTGRSWDHYCLECARIILQNDLLKLQALARALDGQ
jgi:hypothetical protein